MNEAITVESEIKNIVEEYVALELALIDQITKHIQQHNISYRGLAKLTKISSGTLRYHLSGDSKDSLKTLLIVAHILNFNGTLSLTLKPPVIEDNNV